MPVNSEMPAGRWNTGAAVNVLVVGLHLPLLSTAPPRMPTGATSVAVAIGAPVAIEAPVSVTAAHSTAPGALLPLTQDSSSLTTLRLRPLFDGFQSVGCPPPVPGTISAIPPEAET